MAETCFIELVGLVLLSLALLISLFINIIFCIKQRATMCRDTEQSCLPHREEGDRLSQEEGHYFHNINHHEQQENHHDYQEEQENPVYGNIRTDAQGFSDVCYEMMTMQPMREHKKTSEADLNYASLDLKRAKKHKKKLRHQHQGRNSLQDQQLVHPGNTFLGVDMDMDMDMDAQLPPRDTSTMVSHSSIYLNSQQIAQEAEEMERERGMNKERENESWEGRRTEEDGRNTLWKGERESKERIEFSNENMCLLEAEEIQASPSDHSFDHNSIL